MAAFGLTDGDIEAIDVWPDNLPALNVFVAMATQWRTGMGGPVGLDYAALPAVFRLIGTPRAAWPGIFDDLRVMEAEALNVMSEQHGHE